MERTEPTNSFVSMARRKGRLSRFAFGDVYTEAIPHPIPTAKAFAARNCGRLFVGQPTSACESPHRNQPESSLLSALRRELNFTVRAVAAQATEGRPGPPPGPEARVASSRAPSWDQARAASERAPGCGARTPRSEPLETRNADSVSPSPRCTRQSPLGRYRGSGRAVRAGASRRRWSAPLRSPRSNRGHARGAGVPAEGNSRACLAGTIGGPCEPFPG